MKWLMLCVALVACKAKSDSPSTPPAGSGAPSAPTTPTAADAAVAAPPVAGVLEYEKEPDELYKAIFGDKVPVLPALSADGEWIASFDSDASGMMTPAPMYVAIRRVDNTGTAERLEIIDDDMAGAAQETQWEPAPPESAVKILKERGAAVMKRLAGFSSLVPVDIPVTSNGDPQPAQIGDLTLTIVDRTTTTEDIVLTLSDAAKHVVRKDVIEGYGSDEKPEAFAGGSCSYRPIFGSAFSDRSKTKLFLVVQFRWHEECSPQSPHYIAWTLPGPTDAAIAKLVAQQLDPTADFDALFAPDAQLVDGTSVSDPSSQPWIIKAGNEVYSGHTDDNVQVVLSRDGQSAWASLTTKLTILPQNEAGRDDPWRVSSVLAKTASGWKIVSSSWTSPVPNAKANADAKAGKLTAPGPFTAPAGDASLNAAFAKLASEGIDAASEARTDLVAIGSGPNERTIGGGVFARGWNAGWKKKATILSSIAKLAPSGTTGSVAAAVSLSKGSYKIPFTVFAVFDKSAAGTWTLVHIHFSV